VEKHSRYSNNEARIAMPYPPLMLGQDGARTMAVFISDLEVI
jgi:hypothetical protein